MRRILIVVLGLSCLLVLAGTAAAVRKPKPGSTMVVKATAYAGMQGTAIGVQTRHGICAVDPKVIPLGTRFYVPGYGNCLAADTGGAVKGAFIDVWMLREGPALQWGVKHLTIRFL